MQNQKTSGESEWIKLIIFQFQMYYPNSICEKELISRKIIF